MRLIDVKRNGTRKTEIYLHDNCKYEVFCFVNNSLSRPAKSFKSRNKALTYANTFLNREPMK